MSDIQHKALSDELHRTINGRSVRAAVFTTFRFEPGFFEPEVLPVLFDIALSQVPEVRLLNLEEPLRNIDGIAVYYDRQGLESTSGSSRLPIERVPIRQPTGYFHPKNVLVLVEEQAESGRRQSLIVGAMSANLTRAGWWTNVEVVHLEEVAERAECSFRGDLLVLIRRLKTFSPPETQHEALESIHSFVVNLQPSAQRIRERIILPRLFAGEDFIGFLRDDVKLSSRLSGCNLEVISPYFDASESLGPIKNLQQIFRPAETRVFLPRANDATATCSEAYYKAVTEVGSWATLPDKYLKAKNDQRRRLHAKVYRFFNPRERFEAFFIGSVNLTNAGFNAGGNFESGFYVEVPCNRRPEWWLELDESVPQAFAIETEADQIPTGEGWKLSIRYRWSDGVASCYWDDKKESPAMQLLASGVHIATLGPLPGRQWLPCDEAPSKAIAAALTSSSILQVEIDGQKAEILVEEEQMTHKPSLLATITATEILRYWSLLTPEQKKEFLESHPEILNDPEAPLYGLRPIHEETAWITDTFAHIYFSFSSLERAVLDALKEKRMREVVDRLFGRRFDSMRRLLEKLREDEGSDPVNRYVTLLCAEQTLRTLKTEAPELFREYSKDVQEIEALLAQISEARAHLAIEDEGEFFKWYERWFSKRAEPVEVQP